MSGYGVSSAYLIPSKKPKKEIGGGKMKKKILIAVLAIALLIGTVSAALVYYLSNVVIMSANVTSPIELRLYYPNGTRIESALQLKGGSSVDFSKIAYNHGTSSVPFAIVLIIKNSLGEGIVVDSAGPKDDKKSAIGNHLWTEVAGSIWNRDDLWWQIEGQAWYLHDAYDKYDEYFNDEYVLWGNPQNTVYDDGGGVNIGGTDYYVVVFGGTIGPKPANGIISESEKITNWGWGTPTTYNEGTNTPCMMPGESYDVGKVRINFAPNYQGSVAIRMQVVMPGSTVAEIVAGMFP